MAHVPKIAFTLALLWLPTLAQADEASVLAQGRKLFQTDAEPACAICHTLADAGAKGKIGPVLDELKPSEERVLNALKNGKRGMPPFVDHLTIDQMNILAKYVSTVTGGNAQRQ
ncbi:cytochrome c [Limnobacter sp.]|uniref:SorU family sulfite dehydrogenase c-type cytochrome subunit n=1 Tax=Limnobacter sp. TaxID=2003368 RepID=UPI00351519F9